MIRELVPGSAGVLEVEHVSALPNSVSPRQAILCHPHSHYGGTMDDPVLGVIAQHYIDHGIDVARFNFRGVGRSEGRHDGGAGEVEDLRAVHAWLGSALGLPPAAFDLAGYSFGANVVWQAAAGLAPASVLLVAPPIPAMHFDASPLPMPVHVVAGSQDEFIEPLALQHWCNGTGAVLRTVPDGDHFLAARPDALRAALPEPA